MTGLRDVPRDDGGGAVADGDGIMIPWSANMISVANGRDTFGFLLASRGGAWRAIDADGRLIGEFPSRAEARAAIVRRAFGGRP